MLLLLISYRYMHGGPALHLRVTCPRVRAVCLTPGLGSSCQCMFPRFEIIHRVNWTSHSLIYNQYLCVLETPSENTLAMYGSSNDACQQPLEYVFTPIYSLAETVKAQHWITVSTKSLSLAAWHLRCRSGREEA